LGNIACVGEYDNAPAHNKALSVIEDGEIPEQFQSRATPIIIGIFYLNANNYVLAKSYFQKDYCKI
jgi:hypothetical protein